MVKRTPLTRKTPLQARTPMKRGNVQGARTSLTPGRAPLARARAPKPAARKDTGPTRDVRESVKARDDARCVRCGAQAGSIHHRSGRGMGGRHGAESDRINQPAWLLCLCGSGTTGCHEWVESNRARATELGYLIPRNGVDQDAEAVPVRTLAGWTYYLNDATTRRATT